MKNLAILFFLFIFALTAQAQTPKTTPKKTPKPVKTIPVKLGTETEEFEKAKAISDASGRIKAFHDFIKNFPESTEISRAQLIIVTSRVELGIAKFQAGDLAGGIELYKQAVSEAPTPVPDEMFSKVLLGLPVSLYAMSQSARTLDIAKQIRVGAFDIAKSIEDKVSANANQVLELAKFYLSVEYGTEAIRLAQKAVEIAPDSANAYQTLATANRLNFMLEDAAKAYAKAVELDAESDSNKLSLAEMKRALGKPDEAIALFREILNKDSANKVAQAGLALALFDTGKRAEAETELKKALEADPENARLLTSAAYWYAANGLSEQALEYSEKAIKIEPRNVWSYIARARGFMAKNKPLEAEKVLLGAQQYSDFPTLDYELASVRLAAGLYREAAETLKRSFAVNKDGSIETYLGNRILADANSFTELLSLERRVALFETKAADSEDNTNKLKSLLQFQQKLDATDATEDELALAADEFASGGDNMRLHRQLFAASRLLQKKTALPKVLDLMQAAISSVDGALNVASPSSAVLADEIYDSRQYAIKQNLIIVVPEIPRPTLSAILRGQIEDITGRTLLQQNNTAQSIVRLKRALSVFPEKSAWSRASYWHLGEALLADGKEKEALEAFIKGYDNDLSDAGKRADIEKLYIKVNGSTDGLEERIGAKTETSVAATQTKPTPTNTDNVKITEPTPSPEMKPEPSPIPKAEVTPAVVTEVKSEPTPSPKTEVTPETKVETKPEPSPSPEIVPAVTPEKTPETIPLPTPESVEINKKPLTETSPSPTPETEVQPSPTPEETQKTEEKKKEPKPEELKPEPSPSPAEVQPSPTPETKSEEVKTEELKPTEIKPEPTPMPSPQSVSVIITDNLSKFPPSPKVNIRKTEKNPSETTTQNTQKPLFEPVIINVPKPETTKPEPAKTEKEEPKPIEEKPAAEKKVEETSIEQKPVEEKPKEEQPVEIVQKNDPKPAEEKPVKTIGKPEVIITDTLKPENKSVEKQPENNPTQQQPTENKPEEKQPENTPVEKKVDEKILSGENRPRIIITENTGAKTITEEISGCKLIVSPDSLSLLNGGGSLGVSVGFEDEGDFRKITAVSSSPGDVQVSSDPEIGANLNRAFFIIKSVSAKTGIFTVTFESPCGKKEILVKVR